MLLINNNWPWSCILPVAVSLLILAKEVSGAEQTTNTETALEQAETLLKTACGDPKKKSAHCDLTDELATRAVALLDHADPFVRGIADWAITIRVATDNDHRNFWPRPNPPTWFSHWSSYKQGPALLENDYVRQAVALGLHRTSATLLKSAEEICRRTEGPASEIRERGTPTQKEQLKKDMAVMDETFNRLRNSLDNPAAQRKIWLELRKAARKIVLANPDINFIELAYVTRYSCIGPHNLASYSYHPDHYRPGGNIIVQRGLDPDSPTRSVLGEQLGKGHVRGMDLWWDADRVCFGFTRQPNWKDKAAPDDGNSTEPTHIFEIRIDGTQLRQFTSDTKWVDTEPAYLPDGGVVFGSDRAGIGSECGGWEQNAGTLNLFRVSADGKTVKRLTVNKDYDRYPHTLDNGLIAFLRWDYAERQFFSCHSLWTVRPDGTMAEALYKSHIQASPYSLRSPHSIPCSQKLVAIACGHHNLAEGAVAIIDTGTGVNNPDGMRYVTPQAGPTEGGLGNISPVAEGGIKDSGGLYQTPWPLSEKCFLVSYAYKHPESANSGIYFIDVWGNKELIHSDGILEAAYPIPLLKRPRPPVLAETTRTNEPFAVCHLSDVYQDLSGIKRGSVKWLRISERVNWVFDKTPRGELRWISSNPFSPQFGYWTWAPVRVIGIVPVETDGSAHFKVPVGLGIYFQALDENLMEVRRMRSHIAFQPGETRACLGCHESKGQMTPSSYWQNSIAAGKPPAMPIAPPWGDCALMDYSSMIQPILDRRCITCHGTKEPKGGLDLTAIPDAYGFSQSYRSMFGLKPGQPTPVSNGDGWYSKVFPDVKPFEDKKWYALVLENKAPGQIVSVSDRTSSPWEKKIDASISQPKQFGSHQSKLILKQLRDEKHRKDANLTKDEWLTLVTWVDANAPYTSLFFQKFSDDGKKLPKPERVALKLAAPWAKTDINDNKSTESHLTKKGINDETH
jgi:hypothetical protein